MEKELTQFPEHLTAKYFSVLQVTHSNTNSNLLGSIQSAIDFSDLLPGFATNTHCKSFYVFNRQNTNTIHHVNTFYYQNVRAFVSLNHFKRHYDGLLHVPIERNRELSIRGCTRGLVRKITPVRALADVPAKIDEFYWKKSMVYGFFMFLQEIGGQLPKTIYIFSVKGVFMVYFLCLIDFTRPTKINCIILSGWFLKLSIFYKNSGQW